MATALSVSAGSDVISTGDIFDMTSFPFIDLAKGGSIQGILAALNRMDDMAEAEFRTEGGTLFIPGHGRFGDLADLAYYRDMCHHHSRPRSMDDEERYDSGADQSGQTD